MWKSLCIVVALAIAALAGLKLAQHAAAKHEVARIAAAIGPSMRLTYGDVGGALDGRVVLEKPKLEVLAGPAKGAVLRADRVTIDAGNVFWLVSRALTGDRAVPASLGLRLAGTTLGDDAVERLAAEGWFGIGSGVPFETLGCEPVRAFSARDYARMGLALRPRDDDVRYTYDPAAHTLRADIVSTTAPFATVSAHVEMSSFDPAAWLGDAHAAKAQRIEQVSLTYLDGGYLAQRNRFCAQLTGTDAAGYANRHLAAVKAFLDARGVELGDDVATLYRKLVADGGSAELSSLPEASFVPADFTAYAPENLLRELNVTVRRNTAPPILLRLAFVEPSSPPGEIGADDDVPLEIAGNDDVDSGPPAPPPVLIAEAPPARDLMPLISTANAAALPMNVPSAAEKPEPIAPGDATFADSASATSAGATMSATPSAAVATPGAATVDAVPASAPPSIAVPPPSTNALAASSTMASATVASTPAPRAVTTLSTARIAATPPFDPRDASTSIPASAAPPAPDSIAALVWRAPTIERLPVKAPVESEYVSVPAAALGAYAGSRVRLFTLGGKRVDGRVQRLDGNDIVLTIARDGGTAEMRIPQATVRDARLRSALTSSR
jgi:hypothetical protein